MAERYGLFTLIVLGESVLSATMAVQTALDASDELGSMLTIAFGGLLIVGSMWWVYFSQPSEQVLETAQATWFGGGRQRDSFIWGYGHSVVFASAAAVGAGIAVAVDAASGHAELSERGAATAVAVAVALYMLSVWAVSGRFKERTRVGPLSAPVSAAAVLVVGIATASVLAVGLTVAATVAAFVVAEGRDRSTSATTPRT